MRLQLMIVASLFVLASTAGCDGMSKKGSAAQKSKKELAEEQRDRMRRDCASEATYAQLKDFVFAEAARIRNGDPRNLDPVAAGSVVRMEDPLVKSRDDRLNVTVCTGRFTLELPPGAENAFDGLRRVSAEVEYSAQPAADDSGLVFRMDGAEPIIYRLATFGLNGAPALPKMVPASQPAAPPAAPPQVAAAAPVPDVPAAQAPAAAAPRAQPARPRPAPQAAPAPAATPTVRTANGGARPSYNCRYARTRSEKLVCSSPALAARDRTMSAIYYRAIAGADPVTKRQIRAGRDAFLARRERCGGSPECINAVYGERIAEIRGMTGE
jgi:hypothetical protein